MDTLTNDQPVDDAALFADVTGLPATPADPAAPAPQPAPAAPSAPVAPTAPATEPSVPSGRLREESDARRAAERERDDLRTKLAAMEAPKPAPPKPEIDPWADPKAFSRSVVDEALNPLQHQVREVVFTYSRRDALRDHGAEKVGHAEQALEAAVRSGQVNADSLRTAMNKSLDPVGDVVRWFERHSTLTKVGADPEKWFEGELAKRFADPVQRTRYLEQLQQPLAAPGAPLTEAPPKSSPSSPPPSLRNLGTSAAPAAANSDQRSDAELFADITARRR